MTWLLRHIALFLFVPLFVACAPDLVSFECDGLEHPCPDGFRCERGVCAVIPIGEDTSSDLVDTPTDETVEDTSVEEDGIMEVSLDPIEDGVISDDGDLGGGDPEVFDTAADNDADTGVCSGFSFPYGLTMRLYEPCGDALACDGPPDEWPFSAHRQTSSCSSFERTDEPIEVPLVNGYLDHTVAAYFDFRTDLVTVDTIAPTFPTDSDFAFNYGGPGVHNLKYDETLTRLFRPSIVFSPETTVHANSIPLSAQQEWTMMFYLDIPDVAAPGVLFRGTDGAVERFRLALDSSEDGVVLTLTIVEGDDTFHVQALLPDSVGWHHLALVAPPDAAPIAFFDGVLLTWEVFDNVYTLVPELDALVLFASDQDYFNGTLDELIFMFRAMTPYEIRSYLRSASPFGTSLFDYVDNEPGSYDDLRVWSESPESGRNFVPFEIIGVRPQSGATSTIIDVFTFEDSIESREGVEGISSCSAGYETGRYGDDNGSFVLENTTCSLNTAFDGTFGADFTIEFWVFVRTAGTILWLENGNSRIIIDTSPASNVLFDFEIGNTVSNRVSLPAPASAEASQWHHVALTRATCSETSSEPCDCVVTNCDRVRFYVDGDLRGEALATAFGELNPVPTESINIGSWTGADGFVGDIDDLVFHDTALDVELIRRRAQPALPTLRVLNTTREPVGAECVDFGGIYDPLVIGWGASELPPLDPEEPDCVGLLSSCAGYVGWWRFDEGWGTIARDSSSLNRHLCLLDEDEDGQCDPITDDTQNVPLWRPGYDGEALAFIDVPSYAWTSLTGESWSRGDRIGLQMALWMSSDRGGRPDETALFSVTDPERCRIIELIHWDNGIDATLQVRFDPITTIACTYQTDVPSVMSDILLDTDVLDSWHTVTFQHGFDAPSVDTILDFDGTSAVGTLPSAFQNDEPKEHAAFVSIGGRHNVPVELALDHSTFAGRIDSVRLMRPLNVEDVDVIHYPMTQSDAWWSGEEVGERDCVAE